MVSVIMAGGVGERFWPCSRSARPKQLMDLTGKGSMISLTVDRVGAFSKPEEIFVLTTENLVTDIADACGGRVAPGNVVGEPMGRNTAPSVGLAALLVRGKFGDRPFMVLPADHIIDGDEKYAAVVQTAEKYAEENDCLLTFGIRPTRPETGYGYVQAGDTLYQDGGIDVCAAESFHEKPTPEGAKAYLAAGNYFWNSGMFCWRPSTILNAIEEFMPELNDVLLKLDSAVGTAEFQKVLKKTYPDAPAISVDYGIMEKAENVVLVPGEFYWNDVGNWESIREIHDEDDDENVLVGDHALIDSHRNTIFSPDKLVGVIGVDDLVVVDGGDAILVCKRDRAQEIRELLKKLRSHRRDLI